MDRKKRHRALAGLRDYFLLERKQREIKEASTDQRASVYEYRDAAQRRLEAARVLLEAGLFHEALVLFSAGAVWLAKAVLCWRDPTADVTSIKGDELGRRLSVLLEDLDDPTATRYARILARTIAEDPTAIDHLPRSEAAMRSEELDRLTRWLSDRIEPQSLRELARTRSLRLSAALLTILATPVAGAIWAVSPTNVSLHKPVTVSSQVPGTNPPGVVDDDMYALAFQSAPEASAWLVIDLGKRHMISDAEVFGRSDCCLDQSVPLAFELSDDGVTYRTVATKTDSFQSLRPWVVKPLAVPARFVRLRMLRAGQLALAEVVIFGHPQRR